MISTRKSRWHRNCTGIPIYLLSFIGNLKIFFENTHTHTHTQKHRTLVNGCGFFFRMMEKKPQPSPPPPLPQLNRISYEIDYCEMRKGKILGSHRSIPIQTHTYYTKVTHRKPSVDEGCNLANYRFYFIFFPLSMCFLATISIHTKVRR